MDNPVQPLQKQGAARGRRLPSPNRNSVGVQPLAGLRHQGGLQPRVAPDGLHGVIYVCLLSEALQGLLSLQNIHAPFSPAPQNEISPTSATDNSPDIRRGKSVSRSWDKSRFSFPISTIFLCMGLNIASALFRISLAGIMI